MLQTVLRMVIPYTLMFVVGYAVARVLYKKKKPKEEKKKIGVMDLVLIIELIAIVIYVIVDFWVFYRLGVEPSTLTASFFAVCGGENGAMAWIRTRKQEERYREWQKSDEGKDYKQDKGL